MFFKALIFLTSLTGVNSSSCISINNQEYKVRPQIADVNSKEPVFLVLKSVNAAVVVIISMIHMQNYVFLIL